MLKRALLALIIVLVMPGTVLASEEGNKPVNALPVGTKVIFEGTKGVLVSPEDNLILLDKTVLRSFDTEERNNYDTSPIKTWLNTEFKSTLANNEWITDGSVSLLSEDEYREYKEYLSANAIGWLKEAMIPADEPAESDLFIDNKWNYVKAILNGDIVGLGYATTFYASPITIELKDLGGYKLKNAFGKPRILIPEESATSDTGEFSSLTKGDKIRFANKWWTLVDAGSKKLLGEFDYLSQYIEPDQEIDEDFKEINTYQFSNEVTGYDASNPKSIAHFLKNDFKDNFINKSWIADIDLPTKAQYDEWKSMGLGEGWLIYETENDGKDRPYLITADGLVTVNPGESYPIRALVKLIEGLYLEDIGGGYYGVTGQLPHPIEGGACKSSS
jgi:hypothetical protein